VLEVHCLNSDLFIQNTNCDTWGSMVTICDEAEEDVKIQMLEANTAFM